MKLSGWTESWTNWTSYSNSRACAKYSFRSKQSKQCLSSVAGPESKQTNSNMTFYSPLSPISFRQQSSLNVFSQSLYWGRQRGCKYLVNMINKKILSWSNCARTLPTHDLFSISAKSYNSIFRCNSIS